MRRIKQILLGFFLIPGIMTQAQNILTYGEYWLDDNDEARYALGITENATARVSIDIDLGSLSIGLHSIHFRFRDDSSRWTSPVSRFFIKTRDTQYGILDELVKMEYWFDENDDSRISLGTNENATANVSLDLNLDTLSNGLHSIHFRFQDGNGRWTSAGSRFFVKLRDSQYGILEELSGYEYWFDMDQSNSNIIAIEKSPDFKLEQNIDITELNYGLHTLNMRFQDSNGNWSPALSKFFISSPPAVDFSGNEIDGIEYWIDGKISERKKTNLSSSGKLNYIDNMDLSTEKEGLHSISFRFTDKFGQYSAVTTRYFIIHRPDELVDQKLKGYRYWVDGGPMTRRELENPKPEILMIDSIDLKSHPKAQYIVHFQFQDEAGNWSGVIHDTIQKLSFPWAHLEVNQTEVCAGDSLLFSSILVDADSISWDPGTGIRLDTTEFKYSYLSDGIFNVKADIFDTSEGISKEFSMENPIQVFALPLVDLGEDIEMLDRETIDLDGGEGFSSYSWNGEEGSQSYSVIGSVFGAGSHEIRLEVRNEHGCRNSDTIQILINSTIGIMEKNQGWIKIYPNPSSGFIQVDFQDMDPSGYQLRIIDLSGRTWIQEENLNHVTRLELSSIKPGQYMIILKNRDEVKSIPFIKL